MASVIRRDRGWNRIKVDISALNGRRVKVGLLAGGPVQDGVRVVDYATWNEYGTADGIPSRPFMRRTADFARRNLNRKNGRFAALIERMIAGGLSGSQVLDGIGLWYQAEIRKTIRTSKSWATPLSPTTIAAKKSSVPLIDNAIMIGAINYEKTRG